MIYSDNERRVLFRKICSLMLIKCFTGLQQHKHKTKHTQVTPHPTIRPESYKAQPSARGHPQIPHFITRPSIPDWSKSMQDNSQRPRPSITPPLPPPPHNPSMHPPPNPPIYHPPRTPLAVPTSTRSPPFFLLCPAFSIPSIRPHILTSRLRPPTPAILSLTAVPSFLSISPVCFHHCCASLLLSGAAPVMPLSYITCLL